MYKCQADVAKLAENTLKTGLGRATTSHGSTTARPVVVVPWDVVKERVVRTFFSTSACVGMRSFAWDGVLRVFMVLHGVNKCNIAVRPIKELVGVRMVRWQVEWTEVCVMPCHNFANLSVT